ncbi:MAG: AraC family transcriptional regulator [Verrucomicrobiales bacterium]
MSQELQSILLEDFEITWPGFALRRVALNQHMPRVEKLSEHRHASHQALLYLRGYGTQHLGEYSFPVRRGSLVVIPPDCRHRFEKARHWRPVCLAVDFHAENAGEWKEESLMSPPGLANIERWLVELNAEEAKPRKSSIRVGSLVLRILSLLEASARPESSSPEPGPVSAAVQRVVDRCGLAGLRPGQVAHELDRSLDHLNRQLRAETGRTVGETLGRVRLERSAELLRAGALSIGEVGSAVGMDDQNYFSRWFRKQTGETPTRWREAMR